MVWNESSMSFSCMWISSFFQNHLLKRLSFPYWLYVPGTLVKDRLTVDAWIYFWTLFGFIDLHMSVFMWVPYCFNYYSFIIYFEVRSVILSALFFFFKIILAIQYLLWFHMKFRIIFFCFCKESHWGFDRNYIESISHFG